MIKKKVNSKAKVIVILGPTASGKTSLALKLAARLSGEIVSADSRQVYRGLDVGSGKDLAEYAGTPYHLIDVADPSTVFSLADYQKLAYQALTDIIERKKVPFLVGGSGLYLEAVVDDYLLSSVKPVAAKRLEYEGLSREELCQRIKKINHKFFQGINNSDLHNQRRLVRYLEILSGDSHFSPGRGQSRYDFLILGLKPERVTMREKIYQRLIKRLEEEDMIGEVESLHQAGLSFSRLESFGLEYGFIAKYLQKKISYQQLVANLFLAISRFARRQMSWFRRWEKRGRLIHWVDDYAEAEKKVKEFLSKDNARR